MILARPDMFKVGQVINHNIIIATTEKVGVKMVLGIKTELPAW